MRVRNFILLSIAALIAGIVVGAYAPRWPVVRDWAGQLSGRGRLVGLVNGTGFYNGDVETEVDYARMRGAEPETRAAIVHRLVAEENLKGLAVNEALDSTFVQHQDELLFDQFADAKRWTAALSESGLSEDYLRAQLRRSLAAREFLETKIAAGLRTDAGAIESYFRERAEEFSQTPRFRAAHLFLAAPAGSPADVIESKRQQIDALEKRLAAGEDFAQLAAEASEDEATKNKGGDLGWFSFWRMPPDFFQPISKLKMGETTKPFQTVLGFHIVRLIDQRPGKAIALADARAQIADRLLRDQRARAVAALETQLGREALWFRP